MPGFAFAIPVPEVPIRSLPEPARASPNGFDDLPVGFAVGHVLREVVIKGGANDSVRIGSSAAQGFQIFEIAAMPLGTGGEDTHVLFALQRLSVREII